ncbi:MAG: hypothetical protein FJ098_03150 [Deltaproteobacteria bacterium]|nr:hypothetical protein [Deltaproteobacteria bacterium]
MKRSLFLMFVLVLAVGCGSGNTGSPALCTPGATQVCACTGGGSGVQACAADGQSWGLCEGCVVEPGEDTTEPGEDTTEPPPEDTTEPGEDTEQPLVCLLNNCSSDAHCTSCPDDKHTCLLAENRCVACDPNTGEGCEEGMVCTSWGVCAEPQLTCPTDANGVPTVVCNQNADCGACSPLYQVCNTQTHKCQACTGTNTSHCLQSQYCKNGQCTDKCPKACNLDNDCMFCGTEENPAHACNAHKCAECSPTWPCAAGMICLSSGVCYPPCGLPGPEEGTCLTDEDCNYCGDPKTPGVFVCKKPVNDPDGHGVCIPPAEGCEDLGAGVAVLPPPWSDYTQLCSNDGNCANVSIDLNVGALIKDALGMESLDVGIATLEVGDPVVSYAMHECAEIQLTDNIDCGVCVPCKEDMDCAPIDVDPLILDLFPDDPLATIAAAILVDLLWGDAEDHNLNFYCLPIALGYGICSPCTNPLLPCGQTGPGPGGECPPEYNGTGEGACTPYTVPLAPACSACVAAVCANDAYCCETAWDSVCVGEVDQFCTTPCGGASNCAADICTNAALPAQSPGCGPCVEAVCAADPFCCNGQSGAWDQYCVDGAADNPACASLCGGGCLHSECDLGAALDPVCSPCAHEVCTADPYCCNTEWDNVCVEEAIEEMACPCT